MCADVCTFSGMNIEIFAIFMRLIKNKNKNSNEMKKIRETAKQIDKTRNV